MSKQIKLVEFHGTQIPTISKNGKPFVSMKPIVEGMGLNWPSQFKKIKKNKVLSSTIVIMTTVGEDSKEREMTCIPLEYLNGWLFTLDPTRAKGEGVEETIIEYQKECFHALHEHWFGKVKEAPIMIEHQAPKQKEPPMKIHYPIESLLVEGNEEMPKGPVVISTKFLLGKGYRSPLMNLISDLRVMGHNVDGCYHEYLAMASNLERESRVLAGVVDSVNKTLKMNEGYGGYMVSV